MDIKEKQALAGLLEKAVKKVLGDEFHYIVIVGKQRANDPLIVHSLDTDEEVAVSLHSIIGAMMGVEVTVSSGGDA